MRDSLFKAGAGNIGNYDACSFSVSGETTYRGNENSNPTIGEKGVLQKEKEIQISIIFELKNQAQIMTALKENHPYEEIAYEIITVENSYQNVGMGMIGELSSAQDEKEFLKFLKKTMSTECIKHSALLEKKIKKVAVLGGSGSFAISHAKKIKADAFVTADLKYHDYFQAENRLLLVDAGHYETERFTKKLIHDHLIEKLPNFAIALSKSVTNPVKYFSNGKKE